MGKKVDFQTQRQNMIESQVRINDVSDRALILALSEIPREKFVNDADQKFAYAEIELNSKSGRKIMKVRDFSKLAQFAKVSAGEKVLVLGGGGLYSAAIFAFMGCEVCVYDDKPCELNGVATYIGDLKRPSVEVPGGFDLIFFDGGVEEIPQIWAGHLKEGGRMALFHYSNQIGEGKVLVKSGETLSSHSYFDAKPPKLAEFNRTPEFSL